MKSLTKEERVLRVINRQEVDYLPSQISITDRSKYAKISELLGLSSADGLDEYLENHFQYSFMLQDKPVLFREVKEEMERLAEMGFCQPDWENDVVYDSWGYGIKVGTGTFFIEFHPLQGKTTEHIAKFMPPHIPGEALFTKDLDRAVELYEPPDINMPGNFSEWEHDVKNNEEDMMLWPVAYFGHYERTYGIMGFPEFTMGMAAYPDTVLKLLDKVIEYKVEFAKKIVEHGFKMGHHGDDLGTQLGPIWSREMFKKFILPGFKEIWKVFTDAGLPIMLHSCGKVTDYLPDLIDIGLTILEPCQPCNDLEFLKKEYGKDLIFMGGIDTQRLPFMTAKETDDMTRQTIRTLGKGGGYIIAPSQEIMNDVPVENIKAMVQAIKEEREEVLNL
jgi:uroporphyrinogen decarboxylase